MYACLFDLYTLTVAGMTMEQILAFFREAEESEHVLSPDFLIPTIGSLSADELEQLLVEDASLRTVVL